MKNLSLAALAAVAVLAAVAGLGGEARATTSGIVSKTTMITIVVTPSPVAAVPVPPAVAAPVQVAYDPAVGRFARFGLGYAPLGQTVIAAVQTPVPVQINVKPDPTSQFLHINNPTAGRPAVFAAQYGANTLACAYQVYASFGLKLGNNTLKSWTVYDYVYGSVYGGGGSFPTYDAPTTSLLSRALDRGPAAGPYTLGTFAPFYNGGSTGQLTYTGVPGTAVTLCIDLSLTVPNTVAAGTYTVPITYSLQITY